MMKKIVSIFTALLFLASFWLVPSSALAAGASPSGGGSYTVGTTFTVNIVASGATFNTFLGDITISGPVTATITKGNYSSDPSDTLGSGGKHFDGGITSATTSFTIAKISLKGTAVGSGTVTVKNVNLINNVVVATGGGSTNFTITRAPTVPGTVAVSSSTNPDQTQAYGVTTAQFAWTAPTNGATGYSTVFDQAADTTPPSTANTTALTASYDNINLGTYYFHIKAQNGDGWGPVTHYKININRSTDSTLAAPKITAVTKGSDFVNDVVAGTVKGFAISGTSVNLTGYTVALSITPAAGIPTEQALTTPINADGTWSVVFDQPIPVGFYKVTAAATLDKVTTPSSDSISFELSVANGGNAKIISNDDLPKPNLTVTVAGITFSNKNHVYWAIGAVVGFAILVTLLAYLSRQLYKRWRKGRLNKKVDSKVDTTKKPPQKLV